MLQGRRSPSLVLVRARQLKYLLDAALCETKTQPHFTYSVHEDILYQTVFYQSTQATVVPIFSGRAVRVIHRIVVFLTRKQCE